VLFLQQFKTQNRVIRCMGERRIEHGFGVGQGYVGCLTAIAEGVSPVFGLRVVGRQLACHTVQIVDM